MKCETLQYNKIQSILTHTSISGSGDLTFKVIIDLLVTPELIRIHSLNLSLQHAMAKSALGRLFHIKIALRRDGCGILPSPSRLEGLGKRRELPRSDAFLPRDARSAVTGAVLAPYCYRNSSVRLSVTLTYPGHIDLTSSKLVHCLRSSEPQHRQSSPKGTIPKIRVK